MRASAVAAADARTRTPQTRNALPLPLLLMLLPPTLTCVTECTRPGPARVDFVHFPSVAAIFMAGVGEGGGEGRKLILPLRRAAVSVPPACMLFDAPARSEVALTATGSSSWSPSAHLSLQFPSSLLSIRNHVRPP